MHIDVVPNRKSPPAVLLRESYREGKKVKKRTLANLSSLAMEQVELIRAVLRGDALTPVSNAFEIVASRSKGHVDAVLGAMRQLGFAALMSSKPCRERDLVAAMVAARILAPHTKLATVRWWGNTTLASELGVTDATEDDLYAAMDWLLLQQDKIQKRLADRHLQEGGHVLYDLSSSYFEGACCPLARRGYSRDGKKGTLQVNYGMLTDARGCPVAIAVHDGNTADPVTLQPEIDRLRKAFAISQLVIVGDRGMITQKAVDQFRDLEGVDWISALKTGAIRSLLESGTLQLDLFDERNLCELTHPDFPGERLVACRNPQLAELRAHKREDLLRATETALHAIRARVTAGRLSGADRIGLAVGKVVNRYKVAKHFALEIDDTRFTCERDTAAIAREAALDGIYVIRTSVTVEVMDAANCVRRYKSLAQVERSFRTLKSVDLRIRPIHHRLEGRVRSHILLCMLSYYVEWHMREAWRELTFADEDQTAKETRDPVAPATRSPAALAKLSRRRRDDGRAVHSFSTLLAELATITSNTCRAPGASGHAPLFQVATSPNPTQSRALELINAIHCRQQQTP